MRFQILKRQGAARLGRLETDHGVIETPCFMPVGTHGIVKGLTQDQLREAGASIMLCNLYHLALRPGIDVIEELGGLHAFTGWDGPLITDSGGYQVFSLADRRQILDSGVTFRSHLDGSKLELTPAGVVSMQERLGVDIAMVLDECPPWPVSEAEAAESLRRTTAWARQARAASRSASTALFGIVQGSFYPQLREQALADLAELDFEGYALGGVSVGEGTDLHRETVRQWGPCLPEDKPHYLMGVGTPEDILHAVRHGIDLFDCVLPARNARHGNVFTRKGLLRIRNARFRNDGRPLEEGCDCAACANTSRALAHHLIRGGHPSGAALLTLHNLRFYLDFMADLRQSLASGSLDDSAAAWGLKGTLSGGVSRISETVRYP